jgi:hypothetical protein
MRAPLVVVGEPGIEIGLQLLDRPIDLLAERHPVELVEQGAMEALANAVIRYVILGAYASAVPSRKAALWWRTTWDPLLERAKAEAA